MVLLQSCVKIIFTQSGYTLIFGKLEKIVTEIFVVQLITYGPNYLLNDLGIIYLKKTDLPLPGTLRLIDFSRNCLNLFKFPNSEVIN